VLLLSTLFWRRGASGAGIEGGENGRDNPRIGDHRQHAQGFGVT